MNRRRLWGAALLLALLDWSLPHGFLNRLFQSRRWFPVNLTSLFADKLGSPGSPAAILLVSASAPHFWTLLAGTGVAVAAGFRRWKTARDGRLLGLAAVLFALFILTQLVLPWGGENGWRLASWFPVVARGHGRAYEAAYLLLLPAALMLRRPSPRTPG